MMDINGLKAFLDGEVPSSFNYFDKSFRRLSDSIHFMAEIDGKRFLGVAFEDNENDVFALPEKSHEELNGKGFSIRLYELDSETLKCMKKNFPDLLPVPAGNTTSFGFGDRLGIATPGHIRALEYSERIFPIFAQQSVREMQKTNRDFKSVLDDALLAVFTEGYKKNWGADADHIKNRSEIADALEAGFTMLTMDTTEVLNEILDSQSPSGGIPVFENIKSRPEKIISGYSGKEVKLETRDRDNFLLRFSDTDIKEILMVYGKAIDFVSGVYRSISNQITSVDFEVSFDETNTVTTPKAHYLLASLMKEEGIGFTSLALRFPGIFEKGIDYKGDIEDFSESIDIHGSIARKIGGYRLSLHSGSDKLSVYPYFSKYTDGLFHVKTSGTSWLEALRVLAIKDPKLFRDIYSLSVYTFRENNKAYHLSLEESDIPKDIEDVNSIKDGSIIYKTDIRQVLHIAYGPVLKEFGQEIYKILIDNNIKHYDCLKEHFRKHLDALE